LAASSPEAGTSFTAFDATSVEEGLRGDVTKYAVFD
jgi:hypothetical protein